VVLLERAKNVLAAEGVSYGCEINTGAHFFGNPALRNSGLPSLKSLLS
jgi:hypothetical protein